MIGSIAHAILAERIEEGDEVEVVVCLKRDYSLGNSGMRVDRVYGVADRFEVHEPENGLGLEVIDLFPADAIERIEIREPS